MHYGRCKGLRLLALELCLPGYDSVVWYFICMYGTFIELHGKRNQDPRKKTCYWFRAYGKIGHIKDPLPS